MASARFYYYVLLSVVCLSRQRQIRRKYVPWLILIYIQSSLVLYCDQLLYLTMSAELGASTKKILFKFSWCRFQWPQPQLILHGLVIGSVATVAACELWFSESICYVMEEDLVMAYWLLLSL